MFTLANCAKLLPGSDVCNVLSDVFGNLWKLVFMDQLKFYISRKTLTFVTLARQFTRIGRRNAGFQTIVERRNAININLNSGFPSFSNRQNFYLFMALDRLSALHQEVDQFALLFSLTEKSLPNSALLSSLDVLFDAPVWSAVLPNAFHPKKGSFC